MNVKHHLNALCFVIFSIFVISGCHIKGNSTIYNPVIAKNETSGILEISKIEFTDTSTVFYFDAYHYFDPESWFKIAKETVLQGSNQIYKIIGCDGIELGKETYVPESGHVAFVLYFEPVDKSEKTVDFKEGDNEGDFRISGIKLYEDKESKTGAIACTLKGEVIDRPTSSRLILSKKGEDLRVAQWISIPIRDGKFEYVLNCDHEELYELTFYDEWKQGAWRPITFISEQGDIKFTLHPIDQWKENLIEGSTLNSEYQNYHIETINKINPLYAMLNARRDRLEEDGKYYTPEAQLLLDKMRASTDMAKRRALSDQYTKLRMEKRDITQYAKAVQESGDSIQLVMYRWKLKYVTEHPNIVGYSILVSDVSNIIQGNNALAQNDISAYTDLYQTVFSPMYPDHPYTAQMAYLLTASSLKAGVKFIDFTAVDLNGNPQKLSELIAGKPAVLHLWASWCGPCRKKGEELIPVYEEFHDKGFVVIGVAREKGSSAAAEAAIKMDKYPWENLVELNDTEQIWVKYGIGNAGGSDFLIDENGSIVAVAPSIDEIKNFLKNKRL